MRLLFFYFVLLISFVAKTNAQDIFSSIEKKYFEHKNSVVKERVHVITDRDVYSPEEVVWFNVTTFDFYSPLVCNYSKEVKVYLVDKWGKEVYSKKVELNAGTVDGFIQIPQDFADGVYYIQATTENVRGRNYYQKKIVIKKNVVPQFVVEASIPDKEYIPGDKFEMELAFKDLNNEQKRNVAYHVDFYDGEFKTSGTSGKSDKTGKATIAVEVPLNLKSREFIYRITAKSKKNESSLTGKFPVLTDQLYIDFYPENGRMIDGISSTIRAHAYDISGLQLAIEADVLVDGKTLLTFTTKADGLGYFELTPEIGKNYEVQLKRPLYLEKKYDLPPIEVKGIDLKVSSKDKSKATFELTNGYKSVRSVYLVGFSNGDIFWTSEHELDRKLQVDIELTNASGRLVHLVAFNAAEMIEGEHILLIPGKQTELVKLAALESSIEKRGKRDYQATIQPEKEGKLVFTAVNDPWIIESINNQNISSIALPSDLYRQSVFQGVEFNQPDLSDEVLEKYIKYYVPLELGMKKVLNSKSAFSHINEQITDKGTLKFTNPFIGQYKEVNSNGRRIQTNLLTDNHFVSSNSDYIKGLHKSKKLNSTPTYKELLANGTPVMDVLQIIKPYSLEGSRIVFISSAISLSSPTGALIIIDGINSGSSASAIQSLNPLDVESIRVSTEATEIQRYSSFNPAGVIDIKLKDGTEDEKESAKQVQEAQFSAPEYERDKSGPQDFRSTLYWQIIPIEKDKDNANITYYNSDLISNVRGVVYFIPNKGVPSTVSFEYEIE